MQEKNRNLWFLIKIKPTNKKSKKIFYLLQKFKAKVVFNVKHYREFSGNFGITLVFIIFRIFVM